MRDCVELNAAKRAQRGLWHRWKDNALCVLNEVL